MPESEGGSEQQPGATFSEQLDLLVRAVRREDGEKYTVREIATAVGVSKTYLYKLLAGESTPSHTTVTALADFFDVPLDYFSNGSRGRELAQQYSLLAKFGEEKLRALARGAEKLSAEQLNNVLAFIEFEASKANDSTNDGRSSE